jgi:hypothetical protein
VGKGTYTNMKSKEVKLLDLPIKLVVLLMKTKFVAGGKSTLKSFIFLSLTVERSAVL